MTSRLTFASWSPQFRLLISILALLVVPALVMRPSQSQVSFDPTPLVQLREAQPEYVFLGDSMLDSRIDGPYLEELLGGRRVTVLAPGGSATARWYLAFKNYVIPSGVRPRVVFIFFRDRYFSQPRLRTDGRYRREMEAAMQPDEPVVRRLVDKPSGSGPDLGRLVERAYPVVGLRATVREDIQKLAATVVSAKAEREVLIEKTNASFGVRHLRPDLPSELTVAEAAEAAPFSPDREISFLPHLVELAGRHRLRLCLVRVKRRPNQGNVRTQDPELRSYVAALKSYVEASGHYFHDDTDDATLTLATYQDGDHLYEEARGPYTQRFVRRLAPLFL
jgi:hypothetical protein